MICPMRSGCVRFSAIPALPHTGRATIARDDIAFLQYTGGTTGLPKGRRCCTAMSRRMWRSSKPWIGHEMEAQ